jgi:hypothetical protein
MTWTRLNNTIVVEHIIMREREEEEEEEEEEVREHNIRKAFCSRRREL